MRTVSSSFLGVAMACVGATASAQVEEVSVTAQRRSANLQEVPIAVSAFGMQDMSKLQMDAVGDVAAAVPNMQTFTVTANASAMQMFMRGAGVQNPGFNASESPVGIYVDDVYFGRLATANIDLTDIERTEVLRGPQGTLYGRNTIAGAVKFITRTPDDEVYADASIGYGNYETSKLTAAIGGPLIEGKLAGSLALLKHERNDGWIERGGLGGRDLGEFDNKAVRGKLHWYATDSFDAELSMTWVDADNDGYNGIPYGPSGAVPGANPGKPLAGFYDTQVAPGNEGFGETYQLNMAATLTWTLDAFTIKSITGYSDIDDDFGYDLTAGGAELTGGAFPAPFYIDSSSNNTMVSQEINISGDVLDDTLHWIGGVFYMNEDGDQDFSPAQGGPFAVSESSDTETNSYAVFGEGTLDITDRFSVTVGGRYSKDDKDFSDDCTGACLPLPAGSPPADWSLDLDEDFDQFTARVLAQYQLFDNTMVFAGVSEGYQSGGFQTLCLGNEGCASIVYDNQTVTSYEAGIKSELFDQTVRLNASTWYAKYEDIQQTVIDPVTQSFPVLNAGDADVWGLDLEAYWSPNQYLNTFAIVGFASEDLEASTEAAIQSDDLPGIPNSTARVGFNMNYPVGAGDGWDFVFGLDVTYSDDYLSAIAQAAEDRLTIEDYMRLNGFVGFDQADGNWSVILSGTNITDEKDLYSGIVATGFTNLRTPQPPREFMLTAKYSY